MLFSEGRYVRELLHLHHGAPIFEIDVKSHHFFLGDWKIPNTGAHGSTAFHIAWRKIA
jgi:hypothetical protein